MKDLFDFFDTWPVIKWILLVLVAGFIGQFGKMLAQAIIRKIKTTRAATKREKNAALSDETAIADQQLLNPPQGFSPDKKALKIKAKQLKKAAKR